MILQDGHVIGLIIFMCGVNTAALITLCSATRDLAKAVRETQPIVNINALAGTTITPEHADVKICDQAPSTNVSKNPG